MATKTQLELFTTLVSNDKNTRLKAAKELIDSIATEEELKYALNRLTKGVSSGRESARLGFSVALTEVITRKEEITAQQVLELLVKHNTVTGNLKGQEERDYYFGLLFGLQTISFSSVLQRKSSSKDDFQRMVDLLVQLSDKKSWLRDTCFLVLYDLVKQIPVLSYASEAYDIVDKLLQTTAVSKSSEGIGLYLCMSHLPENVKTHPTSMSGWDPVYPLHKSNLVTLSKVLRQVEVQEMGGQHSAWKQKLPYVWRFLFNEYKNNSNKQLAPFENFWNVVVDEGVFASTSSLERKFWGLQIIELALDYATKSTVGTLFSRNFMHCFINHLSDEGRYLYRAARRVVSKTEKVCKNDSALVYPIALHLLGERGSLNFDRLTNTKVVEHILPLATEKGILSLFDLLLGFIKHCPKDMASETKAVEGRRQWVTDTMLNILRSNRSVKHSGWVSELLNIFITYGYFEIPENEASPKISEATQNMFRLRLMSALSYLSSSAFEVSKEDGDLNKKNWPFTALNSLLDHVKDEKMVLIVQMDESVNGILEKSLSVLQKVTKNINKQSDHLQQLQAFQLLYSLVLLQVYAGDTDSIEVLEDLDNCYYRVFSKKSKQKSSAGEPTSMEILTEVMLSLLSRPSHLLRRLVDMLFVSFSQDMDRGSIRLVCDVLTAKENAKDKEGMFAGEGEEEEEEEEKEEEGMDEDEDGFQEIETDEAEGSDWEMVSNQGSDDEELERKLDKVLEDADAKVNDGESSEEELMNDEQMLALDDKLAEVFREKKKASNKEKKKGEEETKLQIVQFKVKVIDLIDNFYKAQPHNGLGFEFILPMLEMVTKTKHKVLEEKGIAVFRNRLNKLRWTEAVPEPKNVIEALKKVHQLCSKKANLGATGSSISQVFLRLLADRAELSEAFEVYMSTFANWIQNPAKSHFSANIFHDFVNWGAQQRLKHQQQSTVSSQAKSSLDPHSTDGNKENGKQNH
ncbi:rRNA processing protein Pol5 [Schizosaccharomyces osmophilus]|uniref:rRNA processing protein Pol5 n=1 Tax=Schizosaccharomyces osmophilus TaxID=2545709 RepID=A0AAE9WB23_9SCHI|nr:rRNA processing protein Pol5 [Schizosaccharomyces osmophilus]WBW71318.1 rRNA processing protein Pol5 [Schizosaccharomyces osmophilus]